MKGQLFSKEGFTLIASHLDTNKLLGNYLEIGCYNGVSISMVADLYPDKKIYAIDPFITNEGENNELARSNTYSNISEKKNIELFEMKSEEFYEKNKNNLSKMNISVVFIDGSHAYNDILIDISLAMDCIGDNSGIIVFDDIKLEDVKHAINDFTKTYKERLTKEIVHDSCVSFIIDKKINMRRYFADVMYEEMRINKELILITGDLGFGMWDKVRDTYTDRYFNVGSAEMLMIGTAIGATLQGKLAVAYSITPFLLYRPFELIRNYLHYENIPVKLVGAGRNRDYTADGVSHWAEEDTRIVSMFPNIAIYRPNFINELSGQFLHFLYNSQPSYMNLKR